MCEKKTEQTIKTKKQPPLQKRTLEEFTAITIFGMILAFNGGFVNAITVGSERHLSVAPMTGASTNVGRGLGQADWVKFGMNIGIILSHITGATVSGLMIPVTPFYLDSSYARLFKIGAVVLTVAALIDYLASSSSPFFYFFLAGLTGLQNSLSSKYSTNVLRTTHISGSLTDMGLFGGRRFLGQTQNFWKLYVNFFLVISFIAGTITSAYLNQYMINTEVFIPVGIYTSLGVFFTVFIQSEEELLFLLRYMGIIRIKRKNELIEGETEKSNKTISIELRNVTNTTIETTENVKNPNEKTVTIDNPALKFTTTESNKVTKDLENPPKPSPAPPADQKPQEDENYWTYRLMVFFIVALCFNGGFINATTLLSPRKLLTSHITGNTTNMSLFLAAGEYGQASVRFGLFITYLLGATICGTIVPSDFYSLYAPYERVFVLGTGFLIIALSIRIYYPESYYFYYIMTTFSGMQSALGCKIKGTSIRTTYMSGCATDIGASLGKTLKTRDLNDLGPFYRLFPSLVGFITGACFATILYPLLGEYQIIVNIVFFSLLGGLYYFIQTEYFRKLQIWKDAVFKKDEFVVPRIQETDE